MRRVKLGLLGNGIGRSRAGKLHEMLGCLCGVDVSYNLIDLAGREGPVSIGDELARCREAGYRGVNVTHPYKQDAFARVQTARDFPGRLSAVNTVVFEGDRMLGDNTDFSGFVQAFRGQFGSGFSPGRVLMLGAGGVGVAIAVALSRLGALELVIHDKVPAAGLVLQERLRGLDMKVSQADDDLVAEMQNADGLVNATPVGMYQYPGNPFGEVGIGSQRWAFDAVYTPENTAFLIACRARNIETLSGFELFLFQGLDAFWIFTGIEVDSDRVRSAFLQRYPLDQPG